MSHSPCTGETGEGTPCTGWGGGGTRMCRSVQPTTHAWCEAARDAGAVHGYALELPRRPAAPGRRPLSCPSSHSTRDRRMRETARSGSAQQACRASAGIRVTVPTDSTAGDLGTVAAPRSTRPRLAFSRDTVLQHMGITESPECQRGARRKSQPLTQRPSLLEAGRLHSSEQPKLRAGLQARHASLSPLLVLIGRPSLVHDHPGSRMRSLR